MQTTAQARAARELAEINLDACRAKRRTLGAHMNSKAPMMLVDWYTEALEAEERERTAYGAALDEERAAQMRAACLAQKV